MKTELSKIAQDLEKGTITKKEARTLLLGLLGVVRSTYKYADPEIKFNCPMCKNYYENNLNKGKVINRCCPSCASELPSI